MELTFGILLLILRYCHCSLINEYFNYRHINSLIIFNCGNNLIQKQLSRDGFNSIYCKINQNRCDIEESIIKIGIILNTSCYNWYKILDNEKIFKQPYQWLIVSDEITNVTKLLSDYPLNIDSDVTIAHKTDNTHYDLYEMYNTGFYTVGSVNVRKIGYWNETSLEGISEYWKYSNRFNLTGVKLTCTVVIPHKLDKQTFLDYVERPKLSNVDSLHRIKYLAMLSHLRDMYNFSYKFVRTNSWGYNRNGSFDGMVGALQRGEAELGGSPVFLRQDRAQYIDYTTNTWQSRPCFIFRHPKRLGAFYTVYTRPFSDTVWFCTVILLVFIAFLLFLMQKVQLLRSIEDDEDTSCSLTLLAIISVVCQQGMSINRRSITVKITVFFTLIFSLNLYQYYNASVVSTLLRDPPKNIRTLEDLLKSPLKVSVEDVLYNVDYFKRTTDPVAIELFKKKISKDGVGNFLNPETGMAAVKKGGHAFHVDSTTAYRIIGRTFSPRQICELQEIQLYPPQKMIGVVKKRSPYKEFVTYGLRRMLEAGLFHRQKWMWDEQQPKCANTADSSLITVTLAEFSMALSVLALGMILAVSLLLCEIFVNKMYGRRVFLH